MRKAQPVSGNSTSSRLPSQFSGRPSTWFRNAPMSTGSALEAWLAAMIIGPVFGSADRSPSTRSRTIARTIQPQDEAAEPNERTCCAWRPGSGRSGLRAARGGRFGAESPGLAAASALAAGRRRPRRRSRRLRRLRRAALGLGGRLRLARRCGSPATTSRDRLLERVAVRADHDGVGRGPERRDRAAGVELVAALELGDDLGGLARTRGRSRAPAPGAGRAPRRRHPGTA